MDSNLKHLFGKPQFMVYKRYKQALSFLQLSQYLWAESVNLRQSSAPPIAGEVQSIAPVLTMLLNPLIIISW